MRIAKLPKSLILQAGSAALLVLAYPAAGLANSKCVEGLWPSAKSAGVTRATFDRAFQGFTPDPEVIEAANFRPAFLATNNFSVLKLYNNSDVYAIFVGHVADMIAANAPTAFVGEWQPVERLPRDRIQRFQEALVAKGHDVGKVDGLAGFKTRRSIGLEEQTLGLPLTCYPNKAVVVRVLKAPSAVAAQ